ncbi:DUF5958 family protein [Streptomyces sp. NPDC006551]|uniref:DUF5958 family protein n=1 Tax=Streptomyces sp. NPDC006551 TaxID=3157178 RepID=UPI0033A2236C
MNERVVVLNGLAQGIRPLDQGVDWFGSQDGTEQFEVLRDLAGFCIQARALVEDGPEAIRRSGIRPKCSPLASDVRPGRGTDRGPVPQGGTKEDRS